MNAMLIIKYSFTVMLGKRKLREFQTRLLLHVITKSECVIIFIEVNYIMNRSGIESILLLNEYTLNLI